MSKQIQLEDGELRLSSQRTLKISHFIKQFIDEMNAQGLHRLPYEDVEAMQRQLLLFKADLRDASQRIDRQVRIMTFLLEQDQ